MTKEKMKDSKEKYADERERETMMIRQENYLLDRQRHAICMPVTFYELCVYEFESQFVVRFWRVCF